MDILQVLGRAADRTVAPTLYISVDAWRKILRYARASVPNEINGFAYMTLFEGNFFLLDAPDVVIIQQEVSPGSADNDDSVYAKLLYQQRHRPDPEPRMQWHSHVNGPAYFSDTDMGTISNFGEAGATWMLSLVTNVRGEVEARLDLYRPFWIGTPIDVVLYDNSDPEADETIRQDIEALVTVLKPPLLTRLLGKGEADIDPEAEFPTVYSN